jgi:hypothetical protein
MNYWNFYSNIIENRYLKGSIIGFLFNARICDRCIVFYWGCSVNRILILKFDF